MAKAGQTAILDMGVIGSPMCAGKAHLIAFLATITSGLNDSGLAFLRFASLVYASIC